MPSYPGTGIAKLLHTNSQQFLWQQELVPAGSTSLAFELERQRGLYYPFAYSLELVFSGAPGAFEVDICHADSDVLSRYVKMASITGGLNTYNATRYEMTNVWTKFVCLQMPTFANAGTVYVTAMITR